MCIRLPTQTYGGLDGGAWGADRAKTLTAGLIMCSAIGGLLVVALGVPAKAADKGCTAAPPAPAATPAVAAAEHKRAFVAIALFEQPGAAPAPAADAAGGRAC